MENVNFPSLALETIHSTDSHYCTIISSTVDFTNRKSVCVEEVGIPGRQNTHHRPNVGSMRFGLTIGKLGWCLMKVRLYQR